MLGWGFEPGAADFQETNRSTKHFITIAIYFAGDVREGEERVGKAMENNRRIEIERKPAETNLCVSLPQAPHYSLNNDKS